MNKGVLWDMDGVLVDTGDFHYQAWVRTLDLYKIPFSRAEFNNTFGMNNRAIIQILLGEKFNEELFNQISDQKEVLFRQLICGMAKPLPGVLEALDYFRAKGYRQAIASSAPLENIDALIDEMHIRNYFDAISSGYNMAGKPSPDVFFAAAKAIRVPSQNCLVIEDSVTGVEGARRAGMTCLAVTNTHSAVSLKDADRVVDSLLEMDEALWDAFFPKLGNSPMPGTHS